MLNNRYAAVTYLILPASDCEKISSSTSFYEYSIDVFYEYSIDAFYDYIYLTFRIVNFDTIS